jgi:hypothetical protein
MCIFYSKTDNIILRILLIYLEAARKGNEEAARILHILMDAF